MTRKEESTYGQEMELPLLPLRGMLVFPHMVTHLDVGRERSVEAVEEAMASDRRILLVAQKEAKVEDPTAEDLFSTGTVARIRQVMKLPSGTIRILVEGLSRAEIIDVEGIDDSFTVKAVELEEPQGLDVSEVEALMRTLVKQFEHYSKISKKVSSEALLAVSNIDEPGQLADTVAAHVALKVEDKQAVLETVAVIERLEFLCEIVGKETEILKLEKRINIRVRKQMEKAQREYYLREQLKAIHDELGEGEDRRAESEDFKQRVEEANLPEEVEEMALREIKRLAKMPASTAEAVVVRNYIEWILDLPWNVETDDTLDIDGAQQILDEDHYGLDKPKKRILEFLAIRHLAKEIRGPILCLVGPPGVGKTSLAKSVARALGRKFVRISLGGLKDEAEIRGHRRTYVGAIPGRIVQGMKKAGSRNPVFLMDEIDKINSSFRGDPAAALLEVLDPEQNNTFSDHYLEVPFDLSRVLFITTANYRDTIPQPLLDRMELIQLPGYTEEEKVKIAERHLIPKVLEEHGLESDRLQLSENALRRIIGEYTREAGVRNVERQIANICRKVATEVVQGHEGPVRVTVQNLHNYLGVPRYRRSQAEERDEIGVATGLVVTWAGGDITPVEVSSLKGKGKLVLTGQLGDVMKESAQAGFTYVRSRAAQLGIDDSFYENRDLHIHVPEGAIPKDGPSAGITMATAIASALSGQPIRSNVAMTGEITLRGRVLPVGGVKEKILAAFRAGLDTVLVPDENTKDLEELPTDIKRKIEIITVRHMDEVLEQALSNGHQLFDEIREELAAEEEVDLGQLPLADSRSERHPSAGVQ